MKKSVIYLRTSSLTNVGDDKDSDVRQLESCNYYCEKEKLVVSGVFYDKGVSGKTSLFDRGKFKELYFYCLENDIRIIVFESLSRFSRDSMNLELGYRKLTDEGFTLISSTNDIELDNSPHSNLVRQILGSISEYQRSEIVLNLSVSRNRKKNLNSKKGYKTLSGTGKCEGRKSHTEIDSELVSLVKKLRRKNWKTKKQRSFREISKTLFDRGYINERGNPYHPQTISDMVKQ
ncbi:MAG: resolvase [Flavobacteriaceae bacterium]|nr:resolvase [Flavobacteriaceae bacterium]